MFRVIMEDHGEKRLYGIYFAPFDYSPWQSLGIYADTPQIAEKLIDVIKLNQFLLDNRR